MPLCLNPKCQKRIATSLDTCPSAGEMRLANSIPIASKKRCRTKSVLKTFTRLLRIHSLTSKERSSPRVPRFPSNQS